MTARTFRAVFAGIFVAVLALMPVAAFAQQGQSALAWKFAVGDTMTCAVADNAAIDTGMGIKINQSQTLGYKFEVTGVADGLATIKVTVQAVKIEAGNPFGAPQVWDSASDPKGESVNNPALKPFVVLLGQSFTIKVNGQGTVSAVEGWDAVMEKMLDAVGTGRMAAQAREQIQTQWSANGIKDQFQSIFGMLPEGPVAPGSSWDHSTETALPQVGKLSNKMTLSYKESKRGADGATIAVIGITGESSLEAGGQRQGPMGPMEISLKNATTTGTVNFDITAGRLVSSVIESTMTLSVKAGQGFEMEQAVQQTRTITFGNAAAPQQQAPERTPGNEDGDF